MSGRSKILLLLFVQVYSLSAQLQVKNFFNLTGRKDVPVNTMVQDKTGFLWLGTGDGLYRFNGREAIKIPADCDFSGDPVTALYMDTKERLWIGTGGGRIYMLQNERLDSLPVSEPGISKRITSFFDTGKGICIGTYGQGLLFWNGDSLRLFNSASGLSDDVIYSIEGDAENAVWCGTDGGLQQVKNIEGNPEFEIFSSSDGLPDNIVRKIRCGDGRMTIAMQDSGVCFFDPRTKTFSRDPFFRDWSLGAVLDARSFGTHHFIATEKRGLIHIADGAFSVYRYEELGIQRTNAVLFGNANLVWLASQKGLSRLGEKRLLIIAHEDGLTDKKVLALTTDNNKVIWIGTTMGISRVMKDDMGKTVVAKMQDHSKYTISCAQKAPDGNIWFGTYGNGIVVLNSTDGSSRLINSQNSDLPNDNISGIHFRADSIVYISTLGAGLVQATGISSHNFKVRALYDENSGLGSNYVYSAITDRFGKLYVGSDGGGLEVLHNGQFINLTKKAGLSSNNIFSLCVDTLNNIWAVSNADGLLKFDRRRVRKFTRREGLREEQPQQLIASGKMLYAVHDKGIDKINCLTGEISYFDIPEGDLEPNLNAVAFSGDRIYSGTNNGVLVYRTSHTAPDSVRPTVYIRLLTVNYNPVNIDSVQSFSYDQNNFAVSFTGVWVKEPDKLLYRYRLAGLENEWQTSGEEKTVNYNNLSPGQYTFVVQARNEEDIWSAEAVYSFTVFKPIWQHWWFWLVSLALVGVLMWIFVKYRLKALQRENLLLEQRVKERTFQIESQSRIIEKKNMELEQLSLVASKTDNVVLILEPSGRLEYVNESFVKQTGLTLEEVRTRYGETIYELSNNPEISRLVETAVSSKRSVAYESLNSREEAGKNRWQSSTLTPIFTEEGDLKKIIIIDTDVTESKRQEQVILQKNKDITDSIYYAKKIQHAILPTAETISNHLPDHFCLYLTKDIVSGDFYWFTHLEDCSIIAAVDCTGHGVPGAFMSLIGYNQLNRIVNEKRITDPGKILLELNRGVLAALQKNDSESRDGMDIAVCRICHKDGTLGFAGAMRPLWIVSDGGLSEIKADKIPIGTPQNDRLDKIHFSTRQVALKTGQRFFIFTDGYADQFGGEKDKKYGTSRFRNLLVSTSHLTLHEQEKALRQEHVSWKGENEQIDDILVIGFELPETTRPIP